MRHPRQEYMNAALKDAFDSKRGWSQTGEMVVGGNAKVTLQADFDVPSYYTVQFNIIPPADLQIPDPLQQLNVYAEITWNVSGNSVRRIISVGDGISISGTGQGCRVKVFDNSTLRTPGATFRYQVTCQISPDTRASNTNAPPTLWTQPQDDGFELVYADPLSTRNVNVSNVLIAAGNVRAFDVPDDAGVNGMFFQVQNFSNPANGVPDGSLLIRQRQSESGTLIQSHNDASSRNIWIPIYPSTRIVTYDNVDAADALRVTHVWSVEG